MQPLPHTHDTLRQRHVAGGTHHRAERRSGHRNEPHGPHQTTARGGHGRGGGAGHHMGDAQHAATRQGPLLPSGPRPGRVDRWHVRHELQRHQCGALRHDATERAQPHRRAGRRHHTQDRAAGAKEQRRLQPDAAVRGQRGHAGHRDGGHAAAAEHTGQHRRRRLSVRVGARGRRRRVGRAARRHSDWLRGAAGRAGHTCRQPVRRPVAEREADDILQVHRQRGGREGRGEPRGRDSEAAQGREVRVGDGEGEARGAVGGQEGRAVGDDGVQARELRVDHRRVRAHLAPGRLHRADAEGHRRGRPAGAHSGPRGRRQLPRADLHQPERRGRDETGDGDEQPHGRARHRHGGQLHGLPHELGESTVDVMRMIKHSLDPDGLMNPGKIFRLKHDSPATPHDEHGSDKAGQAAEGGKVKQTFSRVVDSIMHGHHGPASAGSERGGEGSGTAAVATAEKRDAHDDRPDHVALPQPTYNYAAAPAGKPSGKAPQSKHDAAPPAPREK